MKRTLLALTPLISSVLVLGILTEAPATAGTSLQPPTTTRHFVTNLNDAVAGPRKVGFNVFDTGASLREVRALPRRVKALVWLGEKCPSTVNKAFRSTVRRLAKSPRVFGYYLSDEPHLADCPGGPQALAARAAFIRQATAGAQKSFIVLSDKEDYRAFRPAVTRVSMIGLDPYPCSTAHPRCEVRQINEAVGLATARGIPLRRIVPVYQAFGQSRTDSHYYNLPTADQMRKMIARWARLVPHPPMDYTYGWGHQGSANPTLVDSRGLRRVFRRYFAG